MSIDLSRDLELVAEEILNHLGSADFDTIIDSINSAKHDNITLEKFRSRKFGWAVIEAETPSVYVMGLRAEPVRDDGNSRVVIFRYAIEVYASGDDAESLEKLLARYARAIDHLLLQKYPNNGFWKGTDYAPTLRYEDALYKVCSSQFEVREFQSVS